MIGFKTISSSDAIVNKVQDNVDLSISSIIDKAIIDGVLLKDIALVTGSVNTVNHKLGRIPLGYIVVRKNAESTLWDTSFTKRAIELNCSANVTVNIWVF